MDIELRDYFAAQLMAGKVDDFYCASDRHNFAADGEPENWVKRTAAEVTDDRIKRAAIMAYKIADALIAAR